MSDETEYSANSFENDVYVYRLDFRNMTVEKVEPERVSPNRQGWRARLANVERLLSDAQDGFGGGEVSLATIGASKALSKALAEVRSMLDGETEEKS